MLNYTLFLNVAKLNLISLEYVILEMMGLCKRNIFLTTRFQSRAFAGAFFKLLLMMLPELYVHSVTAALRQFSIQHRPAIHSF